MSFLAPDHPDYAAVYGDAIDAYGHLSEDDFAGEYCSCGRRMHETDTECARCWHDREYPDAA
jgi:hypothetical protein